MGKKREEISEILEDVLHGKLLEEKTDEIIGLFPGLDQDSDDTVDEDLVIWAKSQEMAMEEEAAEASRALKTDEFRARQGAAAAYRNCWYRAKFGSEVQDAELVKEEDKKARETVERISKSLLGGV
jgi:hypothetical protein